MSLNILALDPGLSFAYACFRLDGQSLTLVRYGCERIPGQPKGNAGREIVYLWASCLLKQFGTADEVCSDNELSGAGLSTNVPALGAFEACREFGRDHGRRVEAGRVFGEYPRWVYAKECAKLAGIDVPSGLERWRGTTREYRSVLSLLTGRKLQDTTGKMHHALDAIAVGICHAHRAHGWRPEGYRAKMKAKAGESLMERVRAKREEVTR